METLYTASKNFVEEYVTQDVVPYSVYTGYEDMTLPCMFPFGKIYQNKQEAKAAADGTNIPYSFHNTLPVLAMCGLTKNKDIPNMTLDYMRGLSFLEKLKFITLKGTLSYLILRQVAKTDWRLINFFSATTLFFVCLFRHENKSLFAAALVKKYKIFKRFL